MDGAADVAVTSYTRCQNEPDAAPMRLIVRRVKPTPGSQLALLANYSDHAFITDRDGDTLELEADHRRHAEIENAIRDLKYGVGLNHLPSGRFAANAAWLAIQVIAHNLVWYVGMLQTDPTWVEENRGPAWSSHSKVAEPEQYPWLDVKLSGGVPIRMVYHVEGTHGVPRRARAFSCNSNLRITATNATLPGFPCWRRF